jgi:MFS family permease
MRHQSLPNIEHAETAIRPRRNVLYAMYVIGFVFAIHVALPVYFNSSFLAVFTSESSVGLLYSAGALISIVGFLYIHKLLERWGNFKVVITLIVLEGITFWMLMTGENIKVIAPAFILSYAISGMIGFCIDVFLEKNTRSANTGNIRGHFLTVVNIGWILAPLLGGVLVDGDQYRSVYFASLLLLIPLAYLIVRNLEFFKDPSYRRESLHTTVNRALSDRDLKKLFIVNIIINTFYGWMVIYSPVYLNKIIGLSWEMIGLIFTIMLLPFAIIEIPAGKLADSRLGEKEIMTVGFAITGLSTIALAFIFTPSVWLWALALFMTRVGAALCEIMIETYFFKKTKAEDASMLGAFRVTRPLSYLVAPIITSVGLIFTDHRGLFIIIGALCLFATFFTMTIKDTR